MTRTTRNNDAALQAFLARKGGIDTMLSRLQAHSDDHFNTAPEAITWGHVGELGRYAEFLKRITDTAFGQGECAA